MSEQEYQFNPLREMALHIRSWLEWTKQMRDREGLPCNNDTDIHFPVRPSYRQMEVWAKSLEECAIKLDGEPSP